MGRLPSWPVVVSELFQCRKQAWFTVSWGVKSDLASGPVNGLDTGLKLDGMGLRSLVIHGGGDSETVGR